MMNYWNKDETRCICATKNRIEYIDFAKGIGMLFVVWAHIMVEGWTNWFIYAFHMPFFFFLSGMMFSKDKYESVFKLIKKRIHTLLLPYVMFSVATWAVWIGYSVAFHLEVDSYIMPLVQTIVAQGSGGYLVHNVPLWFVTCLFVVEVAYYFISKLPKGWCIVTCLICSFLGYFMITTTLIDLKELPWSIEVAFLAIIFYCIGNMVVSKYGHSFIQGYVCSHKFVMGFLIIIFGIIVFAGSQKTGHVSLGSDRLPKNIALFYIDAILGSIGLLIASVLISNRKSGGGYFDLSSGLADTVLG